MTVGGRVSSISLFYYLLSQLVVLGNTDVYSTSRSYFAGTEYMVLCDEGVSYHRFTKMIIFTNIAA